MRFAFVDAEKASCSVALVWRTLKVSRTGYYAWLSRPASQHELDDRALLERIRHIFENSRKTYGSPRVHRQLHKEGTVVGHNRIARLIVDVCATWASRPSRWKDNPLPRLQR